jgi:hypothetical protein
MLDKYMENGKVVSSQFPDFDKVLATCKTNPTQDEYELCEGAFFPLLEYSPSHGHLPDSEFEALGFLPDVDTKGNNRRREAGVECESQQWVKNLTHVFQMQLRKEKLAAIAAEAAWKVADSKKKIQANLDLNKKCEEAITSNGNHPTDGSLENLLTKFKDLKNDLCRAFLQVRNATILVSKLPKKGRVDDVMDGPPSLIRMVHEYWKKQLSWEQHKTIAHTSPTLMTTTTTTTYHHQNSNQQHWDQQPLQYSNL